jgi:hypothetical protein
MTPELARIALAFLERSTFEGGEVQAFLAVTNALREIATQVPRANGADDASYPAAAPRSA